MCHFEILNALLQAQFEQFFSRVLGFLFEMKLICEKVVKPCGVYLTLMDGNKSALLDFFSLFIAISHNQMFLDLNSFVYILSNLQLAFNVNDFFQMARREKKGRGKNRNDTLLNICTTSG